MNFFLLIPLSEIRIHLLVVSTASWILTLIPLCSIRFQSVASSEKIHNRSNCSVVVQVNSFRSKDGVGILELKFLISLFSQKTKISSFQGTPIYQFGHLRFRLLRSFNEPQLKFQAWCSFVLFLTNIGFKHPFLVRWKFLLNLLSQPIFAMISRIQFWYSKSLHKYHAGLILAACLHKLHHGWNLCPIGSLTSMFTACCKHGLTHI